MRQNKEIDGLLKTVFGELSQNELSMGILSNLKEHYRFPHAGFYFAYHQLSEKYPKTFNFHFIPINNEEVPYYSSGVENIIFDLGSIMATATGKFSQDMCIDEKMVNILQEKSKKWFNEEQRQALKIISEDFIRYLNQYYKRYSN